MARCHTGFAWTMRSHSRNSSNVIGGWTPGMSFHDTICRAVIETMTSHVVRARRSRSNTNARRSSGSPFRNASTALFGGSWRNTRTKSTSSPSRPEARTTETAARISSAVRGSSGWTIAMVDPFSVPRCSMSGPLRVDRAPDALRRDGHVEVFDAELGERVDDRVDDRAERRRRAAFAAAAQAERVRRRGYFAELGHERWQRVRARQRVVHQRRSGELTGRLVVCAELPQRLADAGGDAAVRLAVQDQWIHRASDVVHRRMSDDLDKAGVGIHFHFAHRAAVRIGRHRHDLSARAGERFARTLGGRGGFEQIDGTVGALHGESAPCELDVGLRGLEERRSDAPALLDDLI